MSAAPHNSTRVRYSDPTTDLDHERYYGISSDGAVLREGSYDVEAVKHMKFRHSVNSQMRTVFALPVHHQHPEDDAMQFFPSSDNRSRQKDVPSSIKLRVPRRGTLRSLFARLRRRHTPEASHTCTRRQSAQLDLHTPDNVIEDTSCSSNGAVAAEDDQEDEDSSRDGAEYGLARATTSAIHATPTHALEESSSSAAAAQTCVSGHAHNGIATFHEDDRCATDVRNGVSAAAEGAVAVQSPDDASLARDCVRGRDASCHISPRLGDSDATKRGMMSRLRGRLDGGGGSSGSSRRESSKEHEAGEGATCTPNEQDCLAAQDSGGVGADRRRSVNEPRPFHDDTISLDHVDTDERSAMRSHTNDTSPTMPDARRYVFEREGDNCDLTKAIRAPTPTAATRIGVSVYSDVAADTTLCRTPHLPIGVDDIWVSASGAQATNSLVVSDCLVAHCTNRSDREDNTLCHCGVTNSRGNNKDARGSECVESDGANHKPASGKRKEGIVGSWISSLRLFKRKGPMSSTFSSARMSSVFSSTPHSAHGAGGMSRDVFGGVVSDKAICKQVKKMLAQEKSERKTLTRTRMSELQELSRNCRASANDIAYYQQKQSKKLLSSTREPV